MLRTNDFKYFLTKLEIILITYFKNSEELKKIVLGSIKTALIEDEQMLMRFKEKKLERNTAIIYLRLFNDGMFYSLLRVVNSENDIIINVNLPKTLDLNQFRQILLSNKKVVIKPRKNIFSKNLEPIIFYL